MTTDSDLRTDVMFEGTQTGTPRKRALFGPSGCGSESPIDDVVEAQAGCPAEDNLPERGLVSRSGSSCRYGARLQRGSGGFPFGIHVQMSREDNNSTPALEPGQIYIDESAYVCGHD